MPIVTVVVMLYFCRTIVHKLQLLLYYSKEEFEVLQSDLQVSGKSLKNYLQEARIWLFCDIYVFLWAKQTTIHLMSFDLNLKTFFMHFLFHCNEYKVHRRNLGNPPICGFQNLQDKKYLFHCMLNIYQYPSNIYIFYLMSKTLNCHLMNSKRSYM